MSKKWEGGKGDAPRPMTTSRKQFDDNWDRIFKKKDEPKPEDKNQSNDNEDCVLFRFT